MSQKIRIPQYRIWIKGRPLASKAKHIDQYKRIISESARKIVTIPEKSNDIDIGIFFCCQRASRPDVDNILKPILDSLKNIVYLDDKQVRSIFVAALPLDEKYQISDWADQEILIKLFVSREKEFLIEIFKGPDMYIGPT
jgi:Holliday junction resolvase RusA-like endonuclease